MKKTLALSAMAMCIGAAQAAPLSVPFQTTVNFTSTCVAVVGAPTVDFGSYTAFASAFIAPAVTVSFNCSRGQNIIAAGFNNNLSAGANGSFGVFLNTNLHYSLALTGGLVGQGGAAATAAVGGIGGPDVYEYSVVGTLPKQAGKYASGSPVTESVTRSVVFVF